jgi:hypothetical protein
MVGIVGGRLEEGVKFCVDGGKTPRPAELPLLAVLLLVEGHPFCEGTDLMVMVPEGYVTEYSDIEELGEVAVVVGG